MGDRVAMYISVPQVHQEAAASILQESVIHEDELSVSFLIDQVNYADISQESEQLTALGIAHSYSWEAGGCFGAGAGYVIFDVAGKKIDNTYGDEDVGIDPDTLLDLIDKPSSLAEVRKYVSTHKRNNSQPRLGPNQVRNGKAYVLRQACEA